MEHLKHRTRVRVLAILIQELLIGKPETRESWKTQDCSQFSFRQDD